MISKVAEIARDSTKQAFPKSKNLLVVIAVEQEDGAVDIFAQASPDDMEYEKLCVLLTEITATLIEEDEEEPEWKN